MKAFYIVIAILFLTCYSVAQSGHTVSGIAQSHDSSGIAAVKIELKSNANGAVRTAVTDSSGRFTFTDVPDGNYQLKVKLDDFQIQEKDVVVAGSDLDSVFVFADRSVVRENVTISIDAPQDVDEVSKSVDVIAAQEMRDRADFTLVDTLRSIPGFRIQQLGGFGRTASIKSRGLRNQDTAVLLDGIRFRDPGAITGDATPFLSDITLTSVDKIEVLRGPGSSLYGTNAIGGTVDFQTPEAKSGVHGQVSGAVGGLGLGRFRSNLSYGRDRFGIVGAFSRTAYTSGIDGNDNADNNNFQTNAYFNPFEETRISGRLFVTDAKVRLNSSPDTFGALPPSTAPIINAEEGVNFVPDVDDPDSIQRSRSFVGQFQVNQILSPTFMLSGYYQGLDTNRKNTDGPLGVGFQSAFTSIFGGTIHTANAQARWTPDGNNDLIGGYEFESEQFRNSGSTPSGTSDFWTRASEQSHTLYAQYRFTDMQDHLQIAGGVRAQWFDLGTPTFSVTDGPYAGRTFDSPPPAYTFDGSASYFFQSTGTKLRTHVGNGYRAPSMYERFGTFFFFGAFFPQGNPELKPERSLGVDAGVDQYFLDTRVRASATWFYTKVKDEITYLPTDDFGAPVYYNFDRHYSRGLELSGDVKATRSTDIFVSYTFTNSDIRNFRRPSIVTLASVDRRSFGVPYHQFTMVVTQRFKDFWISADLLATSSYLAPVFSNTDFRQYTYRFDGNRRLDLTAGYTFHMTADKYSIRIYGTAENLFDQEYFENGFRTAGLNGRIGVSFGF